MEKKLMNEQELVQVLQGFKEALDYLHEQNKALNDKVDELSAVLYDDILSPVQDAITFAQDEENFGKFNDAYSSQLEPYASEYAALYNGNDIARDVYDTYNEHSDEYDEALFVEEAIKSIAATIQETKEKLGIPTEQKVEITETEDGGIEIDTVSEDEEIPTEEKVEVEVEETEEIDNPEEIAAFEAELEKLRP
jgi:hypothetical protein